METIEILKIANAVYEESQSIEEMSEKLFYLGVYHTINRDMGAVLVPWTQDRATSKIYYLNEL